MAGIKRLSDVLGIGEFDIKTGISLFSDKMRTKKFEIVVDENRIGVVVGV